ncbi:MAG: endopeptidase La, partial [Planctomycetota bacterium]|jgi:ATP-dependent Lon protease
MAKDSHPEFPALILHSSVVFPDDVVSIQLPDDTLRTDVIADLDEADPRIITVFLKGDGGHPESAEDLHPVAILCRVVQHMQVPGGGLQVVFQGLHRAEVESFRTEEHRHFASVRPLGPDADDPELDDKVLDVLDLVQEVLGREGNYPEDLEQILRLNMRGAGRFADLVAAYLNFPLSVKREIAAIADVKERIETVETALHLELARHRVEDDVHQRVRGHIDERQREQYLRHQMRAIREALGEEAGGEGDVDELSAQLAKAKLPEESHEVCAREIRRLRSVAPSSAEYQVIRTYVGWLLELPWSNKTEDHLDLDRANEILDEDHTGLDKVKERILEHLAVRQLNPGRPGAILCLVGPPGVGKTSLGKSVARALGREFVRMSVGGLRDEAEIKGHRRTYVGAMPGKILQLMKRCGTKNPVLQIDEIDKMGSDNRGDPSAAILEVLDPSCHAEFRDHYLDVGFDLSEVFFLVTANLIETIPSALRDRLEIVRLGGYTHAEKTLIAENHLVPKAIEKSGLPNDHVSFTPRGLGHLVEGYTREAGLRELERSVDAVCRKVATRFVRGGTARVVVGRQRLRELLGAERFRTTGNRRSCEVGHVTGLAWTEVGGALLSIEAMRMSGNGALVTTGSLGDVMKESARAALSWLRAHAGDFEIEPQVFGDTDIHIHFPEGATPKDGPSAGVAIATCLASLFTNRPVRADLAMTGEITLRGHVLEVGGIKEKLLAAHRGGIQRVLIPQDNLKDLEEIPEEIRNSIEIIGSADVSTNICEALLGDGETVEVSAVESPAHSEMRLDEAE